MVAIAIASGGKWLPPGTRRWALSLCADVCCAQETEYTIGTVLNHNPEDTKDARMRIPSFLHFSWRMLVQAGQVCWVCAIGRSWYQMHSSIFFFFFFLGGI